jgi:hypothetical protein
MEREISYSIFKWGVSICGVAVVFRADYVFVLLSASSDSKFDSY